MDTAGMTSAKPMKPNASGSPVSSYTHQPTRVPIMRNDIMNKNLPMIKVLKAGMETAASGLLIDTLLTLQNYGNHFFTLSISLHSSSNSCIVFINAGCKRLAFISHNGVNTNRRS